MILIVILVAALLVLVGLIFYKYWGKSGNQFSNKQVEQVGVSSTQPELTKSDEINDIEKDLNSTLIENLDADVVGISSQVE